MPFESKDQMKYLYANEPEVAKKLSKKTTKKKLKELPKKKKTPTAALYRRKRGV